MSNQTQNKKNLQIKTKALCRMIKETMSYQQELNAFDLNLVSQHKKQQ